MRVEIFKWLILIRKMLVSERLFVLLVVLFSVVICENTKDSKRQRRHFLALLGYLHGYKIGQDYALQIPQYLITPIIIVPSVNQQQSVNIQQASNDENYQENGGNIQTIIPAKIILDINANTIKTDVENITDIDKVNDDIKVPIFKKPIKNNRTNSNAVENVTDSLRQIMEVNFNKTAKENDTNIDQILQMNTSSTEIMKNETDTTTTGPYPLPNYDNQMINSLTLTTKSPSIENSQSLPLVADNRWQNFTLRANLSEVIPNESNNLTMINEQPNNTTPLSISSENKTENSNVSKGPYWYPNAWYNNEAIDQLSITTNYDTNESPLETHDGWGTYSSMNTLPSGFRPLAGLYYDGYLHTPVKKYGFVPKNYWT